MGSRGMAAPDTRLAAPGLLGSDPIRLLAHNLDFWLPPVTAVIQDFLRGLPVVDNGVEEIHPRLTDGTVFDNVVTANPRMGADLWRGEAEAAEFLQWTVDEADADGQATRESSMPSAPTGSRMTSPSTGHTRVRTSSASSTASAPRSRSGLSALRS